MYLILFLSLKGSSVGEIHKGRRDPDYRGKGCPFYPVTIYGYFGTLKNVAITSSQIRKALDNKCMFDGSSIEGFVRIEESDMYLRPDLDTFVLYPWHRSHGHIARLICDVYKPDGMPFEGDPRYILRKTLGEAADMGFTFNVGPECEFFLLTMTNLVIRQRRHMIRRIF